MTTNSFNQSYTTPVPDGNETEKSDDSDWNNELFQSLYIMSIVVLSLAFVLGVLGNGVVIWVTGFKMKKTVNTVWYLNLAVADFIFAAFLPLNLTSLALGSHWPFGKFMCKLNTTLLLLNMFASVYILVVISVDRCVSVVWPVWAQNHRNVRNASCVSFCVWAVALILKIPFFFFMDIAKSSADKIRCFNYFKHSKYGIHAGIEAGVITNLLLGFPVPFTVIVSCYALMIHRLRRNRTLARQLSHSFKMIAAIIITFFLCWAPYQIMVLIKLELSKAGTLSKTFRIGVILTNCLAALNCCMNPVLYVFIRKDFKHQVRKSLLNALESAFKEEEKHSPTEDYTKQTKL